MTRTTAEMALTLEQVWRAGFELAIGASSTNVRGGRFVANVTGEQFALPEAVGLLRETRRAPSSETLVSVCGADPLNLVGLVVPGPKVPALTNNRVLYRDGVPVAALIGGEIQWIVELEAREARAVEDALIKRQVGSPLLAYLR